MGLPTVSVQVNGKLAVIDNLAEFGAKLTEFVNGLDMKPATDQAFANSEAAIRTLETAEKALTQAEEMALAQATEVDTLRRTVAMYVKTARDTRLMLEKLVKARKEAIRGEILQEAKEAFTKHIDDLNTGLGKRYMPDVPVDFAGVMKNKRSVDSLRNAVDTELARAKIAANEIANRIQINLATLRDLAKDHAHLFADTAQIVLKANDDLTGLVKLRIAEYQAAEEKRLEAERERIRAEESAKLAAAEERRVAVTAVAQPAPAPTTAPAAAPAPAPALAQTHAPVAARPVSPGAYQDGVFRPSDTAIIEVLATHYRASAATVIQWLVEIDLPAVSDHFSEPEEPAPEDADTGTPRLVPVVSSQIKGIGYAPARQLLAIQFNTGAIYHYLNVPAKVAHELATASSIGGYFTKQIKNGPYTYTKVLEAVAA
jgi:hypothetical protein